MASVTRFLVLDPADVTPWAETCGQIRCLVEEKDGAAAEVHHVEITDAKLHYHERTDEFYYVIDGHGTHDPRRRGDRAAQGRGGVRPARGAAQGPRQPHRS